MAFVEKRKKKFGDRNDGHRLKGLPMVNRIMMGVYPKRCDSEVSTTIHFDATKLLAFIKTHNEAHPESPIKFFHCFLAILTRTLNERPKLLRFMQSGKFYERDEIRISFVAKRGFTEKAEEAVVTYTAKGTDNVYDIAKFILGQVKDCRDPAVIEKQKNSAGSLESLSKAPDWFVRFIGNFLRFMDRCGIVPKSIMAEDPSFSTTFVTNLGSIKSHSVYHHLNNYGSCSMMIPIGLLVKKEMKNPDGTTSIHDMIDISFIFDERITDGFYFIKSLDLMKKYFEHPEVLEKPFSEEVNLD